MSIVDISELYHNFAMLRETSVSLQKWSKAVIFPHVIAIFCMHSKGI